MSIYNERIKDIHDPVIARLEELGVQGKERISLNSSLNQKNFYQSNRPTISSRNGYNTSLYFSKTNINVGIGFPKSITFGDSYSLHHQSKFTRSSVDTYASTNTASFTVGDSNTTTHATNNQFTQYKETYSIQKGKEYKSKTQNIAYDEVNVGWQGLYHKKYTQNRTSIDASLTHLSVNLGIVKYDTRLFRSSNYLLNYRLKNYLASSSMIHVFATGVVDNTIGQKVTNWLYSEKNGLAKMYASLYSNIYGNQWNSAGVRITTNHAVYARIISSSVNVRKLSLTNDRVIMGG
jgi:hypothetical protein